MEPPGEIDASRLADISAGEGSLATRVHDALKAAILTLEFAPGAVLRKAPICAALGVSRAPVSEAIARLASEGLVEVVPQSATRVSSFSMDEIREGSFLREALELATVARVAAQATEEKVQQLRRNIHLQALLIEDMDIAGFYQADEEFHALLMRFTGFARLPDIASLVSLQVTRARMLLLPTRGRVRETLAEHRAIYEAIAARDPAGAQEAMRFHLGQLMPRLEALADERPELFNPTPARTPA